MASRDYYEGSGGGQGYSQGGYSGNQGYSGGGYGGQGGYSGGGDGYGGQDSYSGGQGGYSGGYEGGHGQGYGHGGYSDQYQGGGHANYSGSQDHDFSSAAAHAQSHSSSSTSDLFSSAISFLNSRKDQIASSNSPVDESDMIKAHQSLYGSGGDDGQSHDSRSMGMGAAMQALKMFNSSGGSHSGSGSGGGAGGGGGDLNSLIGLAMAQAGKLFDEKQGSGKVVCLNVYIYLLSRFLIS